MVPMLDLDYILLLGYSILYQEYNLTRFNHQKKVTHVLLRYGFGHPISTAPTERFDS